MEKVIQNNEPEVEKLAEQLEQVEIPDVDPILLEPSSTPLTSSESGVELKSLLKLIDNVIEAAPATDDEILNGAQKLSLRSVSDEDGKVLLKETLMVPVKKYPKYNFVGRILGPRGMTVKQLERETGCKIFVRGRASSTTFNPHTKATRMCPFNTAKATLSTISQSALTDDPLHVYIECHDYPEVAERKMEHALQIVSDLLSPPADGKDELKRQQLVDISLINGTYRATSTSNEILRQFRSNKWGHSVDPTSDAAELELRPLRVEMGGSGMANGDFGAVYGITQQRRVWQKPRGPDASSEEYAKSVSSREYVTDIVNKTKNSPRKNGSEEAMFTLPESVVNETLKAAHNLLASHPSYDHPENEEKSINNNKFMGSGDAGTSTQLSSSGIGNNDYTHPPPPLMSSAPFCPPSPISYPSDLYFSHAPASFVDFPPPPPPPMYYMYPPPPPNFRY